MTNLYLLVKIQPQFIPHWLFGTLFITVLLFYSLTLAPGVVGGDAGEHQLAAPLLGIPHATGYPLYILSGYLWTWLVPFYDVAWRMNLFSAVNGALAAGVTGLVVYRLSNSKMAWAGAFMAGLSLSWGLTMWQWSVIAGVRSLNVLFFALLTLLAIVWQQQLQTNQPQKAASTLRWLALTVGLSLAHHRTTLFYLPSLMLWIAWHDRLLLRQPKRLATLVALALAPLSLYAFIYFRGIYQPPYSHAHITDWQSFWFLVGASDSKGLFLHFDSSYLSARLHFIWHDILAQLSWPGLLMAVWGFGWLLWRQPKHALFQLLLVIFLLMFVLDFEVVNLNEAPTWYLMPAYFLFNVWLGIGLNSVQRSAFSVQQSAISVQPSAFSNYFSLLISYFLFLIFQFLFLALPNYQHLYYDTTQPLDEWRQLLRGTQAQRLVENSLPFVEPNSLLLGDWEQFTPMKYYQLINGMRPDVTPRLPLDNWPQQVAAAHERGQPVYFMRKTSDLIGTRYLSMVGPLIQLQRAPNLQPPSDIIPLQAHFEGELELLGYQLRLLSPNIMQLQLTWRAPHTITWDYAISFRLLDNTGQEIYKRDTTHPVLSSYPTSLWGAGEVVGDFYELTLPDKTLTLVIMPYRTEGEGKWHNLILNETGREGVQLGIRN